MRNRKKILLLFINENVTKIEVLHVGKEMCPCDPDVVAVQRYKATIIVIQVPQTWSLEHIKRAAKQGLGERSKDKAATV